MRTFFLAVFLFCFSVSGSAYESPIREDSPRNYTVSKGDTLWDISNAFLKSPWLWPEIWHTNPQIHNPHLIFPGDVISLVYIDGRPRLTVVSRGNTGRTVKLKPKIRTLPAESAIPAIPLPAIKSYLKQSRVVSTLDKLEQAPYIFASKDGRVASVQGQQVFARGLLSAPGSRYEAFREGQVLVDPDSGESLGFIAHKIAELDVNKVQDDMATLTIKSSQKELKPGDRLLKEDGFNFVTTFFPRAPDAPVEGAIVANLSNARKTSRFDTVIINRGQRESLRQGDILAIYKQSQVTDKFTNELINLPPERVGLLMVYRPYEKISYGIVLSASEDIETGDFLKSP